eukprot:3825270-Prymnesium_polylepis.1
MECKITHHRHVVPWQLPGLELDDCRARAIAAMQRELEKDRGGALVESRQECGWDAETHVLLQQSRD